MFFKIGVLKNVHRKTRVGISFLIKRPATLFKKDSNTCVFLESYNIFKNSFFNRIPLVAVFAPGVIQM